MKTETTTEPETGILTPTDEVREIVSEAAADIVEGTGIPEAFAEQPDGEPQEADTQATDTVARPPTNDEAAMRVSQLVTGVQKEREFEHTCFDPIPDDKVREMAEQMAEHLQEAADLENEAKEAAKDFKERIQSEERAAHAIGRRVTLNREEVVVLCTEYFDRDLGRAYVVRSDTFGVVVNRPLMQHERQLYMQFPDEKTDTEADTQETETGQEDGEAAVSADGEEASEQGAAADTEEDKPLTRAEARRRAKALRDATETAEALPAAA